MARTASYPKRKRINRWTGVRKAAGKSSLGSITDPVPQQNLTTEAVPNRKKARAKTASVAMATLPSAPTEHDKLVDGAVKAAEVVNRLIEEKGDQVENGSRDLLRLMLVVRESFKDEDEGTINETAFWQFVEHRAGPARGKPPKNRWQRLAKACVPEGTKRPQVSKYGYVLAALVNEEITSDTVMDEFEVHDAVAGSDRRYTGLDRFVRLFKAEAAGPPKNANPFMNMTPEKLHERAESLIEALRVRHLLNPQIEDVSDLVRSLPPEEKRLKV